MHTSNAGNQGNTIIETQRGRVRDIEQRITTLRQRLTGAIFEKEQVRQAIARGTATPEQLASIAGLDLTISEMHEALKGDDDPENPQGIFAQLQEAREILKRLERERAGLSAEIERITKQRDAGLGDKARAASDGMALAMPFIQATGAADTEAGRAIFRVRANAQRVIGDIASLPQLEKRLEAMGEL